MGCHYLLRGIFLTQRVNPQLLCLLHRWWILCCLSHWKAHLHTLGLNCHGFWLQLSFLLCCLWIEVKETNMSWVLGAASNCTASYQQWTLFYFIFTVIFTQSYLYSHSLILMNRLFLWVFVHSLVKSSTHFIVTWCHISPKATTAS